MNKDEEEGDKNAANKNASSLVKASSAENGSSEGKGKTRNMKKTDPAVGKQDLLREGTGRDSSRNEETGINVSASDVLPQVCLGAILYPIHRPFFFRPFVGLVVVPGTPVTCSRFSSNLSVQSAEDQR